MKNVWLVVVILFVSFNVFAREEINSWSDWEKNLSLKRAKLSAFLAKQQVAQGLSELDRDAQSPKFSWAPEYRLTNSFSVEGDLGITPLKKFPDESIFYMLNVNMNLNYEIDWGLGIFLTGGMQQWIDNGGLFANYGAGLSYQFSKPWLWVIDKFTASYSFVPTPKETWVMEFGVTLQY